MASHVDSFTSVPDKLVELLTAEMPYSLPLLRRLQSTKFSQGTSVHARIIFVSNSQLSPEEPIDQSLPQTYTAAYLDFSKRETQMYIYSTLEHLRNRNDTSNRQVYEQQLAELVKEVIRLRNEYKEELMFTDPDRVLLGSLHTDVKNILEKSEGLIQPRPTGVHDKWLMRREELPVLDESLPPGLHWDIGTLDDCRLVVSRNHIPRTAEALVQLQNLMIKQEDKTPIAWALLGSDGSLISVHVEEPYRRQGLAKKLASKLLREKSVQFGDDGWLCADVVPSNFNSRALCKSLNGQPDWTTFWVYLVLSDTGVAANP